MKLTDKVLIAISALWLAIFGVLEAEALGPTFEQWYNTLPPMLQLGVMLTLIATVALSTVGVLYNPTKNLVWKMARRLVGGSQRTFFLPTGGNLGLGVQERTNELIQDYPKSVRSGVRLTSGILSFPPMSAAGTKSRMTHSVPTLSLPVRPGGTSVEAARATRRGESKSVQRKAVRFRNLFRPIMFQNPHIGYSTERGKTSLTAMDVYQNFVLNQPPAKYTQFTFVTGDDPVFLPDTNLDEGPSEGGTNNEQ